MVNTNTKEIAQNKLIILLLLKEIKFPLTTQQITDIILEKNLINYFDLQICMKELEESNFISSNKNTSTYSITDIGLKTLDVFINRIPNSTRKQVKDYISKNKESLLLENQVHANFIKKGENEYVVVLKVTENEITLIELKLNLVSSKQANIICAKWKESYSQVYEQIMNILIK